MNNQGRKNWYDERKNNKKGLNHSHLNFQQFFFSRHGSGIFKCLACLHAAG